MELKFHLLRIKKKNEYNFPSLDVKDYTLKNFIAKSIKDKTAELITNDVTLEMNSDNIISLMYEKNFSNIE